MNTFLFGHTSPDTAYLVTDYPYGFKLRTEIRYWIESAPKKGDRFVSQTKNPKTGRWNAAKMSTYYPIMAMFLNEIGHVKMTAISPYDSQKAQAFVATLGGTEKLNDLQRVQYNDMLGIREEKETMNEFGNPVKAKAFSVKWNSTTVDITFDRIDGVSLQEVFNAMATLNQSRLSGIDHANINTRGGMRLAQVDREDYNEWLSRDENTELREGLNKGKAIVKTELFEANEAGASLFSELLKENIKEPHINTRFGIMGSFNTIYLTICLNPKEEWHNGYMDNAKKVNFYIHSNGTIEFKGYPYSMRAKPRFRKQSAKNPAEALTKINNYLESLKPYEL